MRRSVWGFLQVTSGHYQLHKLGTVGVTAESRYLELTLIQAERPQVMVDKFQLTFMLLAWLKALPRPVWVRAESIGHRCLKRSEM